MALRILKSKSKPSKSGGHGLMKVKTVEVVKVEASKPKRKKAKKKTAKKTVKKKVTKKQVTKKSQAKKAALKRVRGPVCILSRAELEKMIREMV